MKKICVVTATRAEYGLLRGVLHHIQNDPELELCLIVTGTHLIPEFGYTVREIEHDGFPIAEKISLEMRADTPEDVSRIMGQAFLAFSDVYLRHKPDFLIVLGDRYELIPICFCAVNSGVPIAHISGGETTEGAVDEVVRHCVTKMSYLHFPGCETYRKRIIQLGEAPERVFNFGDPGVENARKMPPLPREELSDSIGFSLMEPYFSVTFHPVTMEPADAERQIDELLAALAELSQYRFLITKANADAGGALINRKLTRFADAHSNCLLVASLGIRRYLSSLKYAEGIIGNSSSGIVEAPCFGIPTINIGDRQKGRLQAESILNCPPEKEAILRTIRESQTPDFRHRASQAVNPYGGGDTAEHIVRTVKEALCHPIRLQKTFFDIPWAPGACITTQAQTAAP